MGSDLVSGSPPVAFARDVPGVGQRDDDAMHGAFSDPDVVSDVAQAHIGVLGDAQKHARMVR